MESNARPWRSIDPDAPPASWAAAGVARWGPRPRFPYSVLHIGYRNEHALDARRRATDPPGAAGIPHLSARQARVPGAPGGGAGPGVAELSEEELRAQMEELRDQLARTPAEVVVANHAFGLFELAALHLSLQPPQLDQARLAIDALAALVDGLGQPAG